MLRPKLFAAICYAAYVHAFENIAIQDTVQAGTDIQGTVANDLGEGSASFDARFTHYRIYLAMTPPGSGTNPSCILLNNSAIDETTFTVNIPEDVGPDGDFYSLSTMEYNEEDNEEPDEHGSSGFQYSNTITLQGATGNWSQFELDSFGLIDSDRTPCTAYGCARECASKFYPENMGDELEDWIPTQECINACPGVVPVDISAYGESQETEDESGETENGASAESTSSATNSASSTARASGSESATVSATGVALDSESVRGSATGSAASASSTGAANALQMSLGAIMLSGIPAALAFASLYYTGLRDVL